MSANKYLIFELGTEKYAVYALTVKEVMGKSGITRLPDAPEHITGVCGVRGRIVPVYDLKSKLGIEPAENPSGCIIIIEASDKTLGVAADAVLSVSEFRREEIEPVPGFNNNRYLTGYVKHNDDYIWLINTNVLFESYHLHEMGSIL